MARARTSEFPASPAVGSVTPDDRDAQVLVTGEAVALDLRPTGFVLRAAGTIIDFVVYIGAYVLIALVGLPLIAVALNLDDSTIAALAIALLVIMLVAVPTAVELLSHGKSLGRLAVGARIVRDDGGAIGFRHAFIRALTGILEIVMTVGGLAAVVALLNARSKRLGDMLAGTYSQYERVSREVVPVFGVPVPLQQWARSADVGRMPDRLSRRISAFLRQANDLNPSTRERLARELAAEASVWVYPLPDAATYPGVTAELLLAAMASVRRDREYAALTREKAQLAELAPALRGLPHGFPARD
jgi:uncharacterized RDD family membrane protein YckC